MRQKKQEKGSDLLLLDYVLLWLLYSMFCDQLVFGQFVGRWALVIKPNFNLFHLVSIFWLYRAKV